MLREQAGKKTRISAYSNENRTSHRKIIIQLRKSCLRFTITLFVSSFTVTVRNDFFS